MGTGLRTRAGNPKILDDAFPGVFRILLDTYKPAVRALLTGEPVTLADDLEITASVSKDGEHAVDLFIVRPGVDKKVHIYLVAHDGGGPNDDSASSIPPPDQWSTTKPDGKTEWRLFNAVVINLEQPHNTPTDG